MKAHEHCDVLPKGVVRIDAGLADLALADYVAPCLLAAESFSLGDADKGGDIVRHGYRPCPIASTDQSRQNRRSAEHTSELQSLMRISYAVFCLTKKIRRVKSTNPIN